MVSSKSFLSGVLALALALPATASAAGFAEVQASPARLGDIEFDWGRFGVYCGPCNQGQGNNRFAWVDLDNNLWLGFIDPRTGLIYPPSGRGVLVDTTAAYYSDFGNGPEWVWSQGDSQLAYTRYAAKASQTPPTPETTGVALARMVDGAWTASFVDDTRGQVLPAPSQSLADSVPLMAYSDESSPTVFWRKLSDPVGAQQKAPWKAPAGLTMRWVPNADTTKNTTQLAYVTGVKASDGKRYQQVFLWDTVTGKTQQLTTDLTQKRGVFMFPAAEFDGDMAFITVANRTDLRVYRYQADDKGVRSWKLVNTIRGPADAPYLATPEQWVHNGKNYVFMTLSSSKSASDVTVPTDLAVAGIDPANPLFLRLTDQRRTPRLRQDPEIYITTKGPFLYYSRAIPGTDTTPPSNEGTYFIDTGLGPPQR